MCSNVIWCLLGLHFPEGLAASAWWIHLYLIQRAPEQGLYARPLKPSQVNHRAGGFWEGSPDFLMVAVGPWLWSLRMQP